MTGRSVRTVRDDPSGPRSEEDRTPGGRRPDGQSVPIGRPPSGSEKTHNKTEAKQGGRLRLISDTVRTPGPTPRGLNLHQAAAYLGISYWTARDYALQGLLPVLSLPALRPRPGDRGKPNLRRVLIDRVDLDQFIDHCRKGPPDVSR